MAWNLSKDDDAGPSWSQRGFLGLPFHILLVDDDEDMLWCLRSVLSSGGYCLRSAVSGQEALWEAGSVSLDLVIVDAKLPDVDGMDLASEIKRLQPGTPVLLISGYYYAEDLIIKEAIQRRVIDGFIAKPFDIGEVVESVEEFRRTVGKVNAGGRR